MNWSELKDRPVVALAGAERLGFVDDLYLDAPGRRMLGLKVRTGGLLTHRQAVLLSDVEAVGEDAVTVHDASRLNKEDAFSDLRSGVTAEGILGSRVLTESGQEAGKVGDLALDMESRQVTEYLLSPGFMDRIRREEHGFPATAVRSLGEHIVVVDDAVLATDDETGSARADGE